MHSSGRTEDSGGVSANLTPNPPVITSVLFPHLLKIDFFLLSLILIMVSPPSIPPCSSPPTLPSGCTLFLSLIGQEKQTPKGHRLLRDNVIRQSKIKQKLTHRDLTKPAKRRKRAQEKTQETETYTFTRSGIP